MEHIVKRYPYLVVEVDGHIEGYAYAGVFKDRAAYDWSCETTIYIAHDARKRGLGRMLYEALEEKLKEMGILNLYACIGYPGVEDEFLTKNSAEFHEHLGYSKVGEFHKCGYKFGRWYNMIWMEKIIGEHHNGVKKMITRNEAFELLKKYNKDSFHIQHSLTVEAVMKWYANELGYGDDAEYWGIVGLLHDIDFELYPEEHCLKAPELLREGGVSNDIIHAVCSHGYGITVGCGTTIDVEPVHEMEKVLFAADELTGLIGAAALIRPSKSTKDMELKSLKKKYKSKGFAAGCSREVIERGADQLGWELDKLLEMTLQAMAATEDTINAEMAAEQ